MLGWIVAFGLGFSVIYGPYSAVNDHIWKEGETITYGVLFRIVWSIALCWVIYACHNGYGSKYKYVKEMIKMRQFRNNDWCVVLVL